MKPPDGWVEVSISRAGKKAGMFLVKGNEIHCIRLDSSKGQWLTRQDLERLTAPLFKEYGHIVTSVGKDNQLGHQFVTRLGFYKTSQNDQCVNYRAERLKHARI